MKRKAPANHERLEGVLFGSNSIANADTLSTTRRYSEPDVSSFKVAVSCMFVNRNKEILVLKTSQNRMWILPGGRLNVGEKDLTGALRRELKEEMGVDNFGIDRILFSYIRENGHTIENVYLSETEIKDIKLSDEHNEYKWVSLQDLPQYLYSRNLLENILKVG